MRTLYRASLFLTLAVAIIHIASAPLFFKEFTEAAFYFSFFGLALLFMALMNFMLLKETRQKLIRRHPSLYANAMTLGLCAPAAIISPGPRQLALAGLLIFITVAALRVATARKDHPSLPPLVGRRPAGGSDERSPQATPTGVIAGTVVK
jgi:hypothetical protein